MTAKKAVMLEESLVMKFFKNTLGMFMALFHGGQKFKCLMN